jgi:hypothetical protein
VPIDERHEFLSAWQPRGSPVVDGWIAWFDRTGVNYEIRRRGGLVMIYTHRMVTEAAAGKHSGMRRPRWCCGGPYPLPIGPEDWGDV